MSSTQGDETSFDDALSELAALGRRSLESTSALEGWELADERGNLDGKGQARLAELREEVESVAAAFDALHATLERAHGERLRRLAAEEAKAVEDRLRKAAPDTVAFHLLTSRLPGWRALARGERPPCCLRWLFGLLELPQRPTGVAAPAPAARGTTSSPRPGPEG